MAKNTVLGDKEVIDLFAAVSQGSVRVLTKSVKQAARIALNYAKSKCPVSENGQRFGSYPHPPGNLRKSLRLRLEKTKKGKRVYQIGPDNSGWYAHFIDYGFTATGGKKLSGFKTKIAGQTQGYTFVPGNRFLRDSIDNNRLKIQNTILEELGKEIDLVAKSHQGTFNVK